MKNNKQGNNQFILAIVIGSIAFLLFVAGCSTKAEPTALEATGGMSRADAPVIAGDIERIEILHFHGTNQCTSCIAVGALAEETVNTYFADGVASGKIRFAHINGELPENLALVRQYGATGSSLWIGVYKKDGTFTKEQNTNVWYKINDKADYMTYLKGVIEQKLAGK